MTTITLEATEKLSKTKFRNLAELRHFLLQEDPVDLVYVEDEQVPKNVRDLVEKAKVLPESAFSNI